MVSNVLNSAFLNPLIRKVFFDGKKDLEALHYILNVGVINFVDTQAQHMAFT
jgi:ribonuclease D